MTPKFKFMKFFKMVTVFTVVLFFKHYSFAQEKKDSTHNSFLGFNFQPFSSYRFLKSDNTEASTTLKNTLDSIETFKYGYNLGLHYGYQVTKKVNVHIGASFINLGEKTTNGTIDKFTNYRTNLYYLSVPLGMNVNVVSRKKYNFHLGLTFAANILLKQNQVFTSALNTKVNTITTQYELNKLIFTGSFNSGVDINLSDRSVFTIDVMYLQSLQSINKEGSLKKYAFGVGPSFEYKFKF